MNFKCLFSHKWDLKGTDPKRIYDDLTDKLPYKTYTHMLYRCEKCGIYKSKRVNGYWEMGKPEEKK